MSDDSKIQKCIKHLASYVLFIFGFEHCACIAERILHLHLYCNFFSTVNANWIIPCCLIELFNWFVTTNITDVNFLKWLQKFNIL